MRGACLAVATLAYVGCFGCGDGLRRVPVQGKLTAKGVPVDGATVQFIPTDSTKGEGGMGRADNEGNFTLTGTRAGAKAVVPGEYTVRVSRLVARDGSTLPWDAKEAEHPGCYESVPAPYNSLDGTPLKAKIPEAGGTVNVDIPVTVIRRGK